MTDGVRVREYELPDVNDMLTAVHESLHDLLPWMPWASAAYSASDAAAWIRTTQEGRNNGSIYDFAIIDEHGRYAGGCGLNQINQANQVANLGYWVRSSSSGRGVAPAAVRAVVAWAFQHTPLNRLEIVVAIDNIKSLRVAEKAGAHRDAVLRKRLMVAGRPSDAALYSFVRPD